jgi:hypothetical protein
MDEERNSAEQNLSAVGSDSENSGDGLLDSSSEITVSKKTLALIIQELESRKTEIEELKAQLKEVQTSQSSGSRYETDYKQALERSSQNLTTESTRVSGDTSKQEPLTEGRRKFFKKLTVGIAGGLVAASGVEALTGTTPTAEARVINQVNPGAIIVPNNPSITGRAPAGKSYGLVATDGSAPVNLANLPPQNIAVYGSGTGASSTGVYGYGAIGVVASSSLNRSQLRLVPNASSGPPPTTGTFNIGEFWLNQKGSLYVYTSNGWKSAIYGYGNSTRPSVGVYGYGSSATGVYGYGKGPTGVYGYGSGSGATGIYGYGKGSNSSGIYGYGNGGAGVYGYGTTGVIASSNGKHGQFKIIPSQIVGPPASGTIGEFWVAWNGALYIYASTGGTTSWKLVTMV